MTLASAPPEFPPFQPLLTASDEPPEWLARDFLLAREYQLIAGEGGSYKTTVFLSILGAIAGGYDVLSGFPTGEPQTVLLISGEDSAGVLKNRLLAIAKGHGWDTEVIKDRLLCLALEDVLLTSMIWQHYIETQAEWHNVAVIGFDPLADLIDSDENDNSAARPVIQWFRRLGHKGHAVLLCHHYGKASEHKQGMARIRGASAWMNAARAIYTIEEKDASRWLGCGKLSRSTRPEPRELRIEIQSDPANRAVWTEARIELAHPPAASWMVQSYRELSPAERTALSALNQFPDEALSWSRWKDTSGMAGSSLTAVIGKLKSCQFVSTVEGPRKYGRSTVQYMITEEGRNALIPSLRQPTPILTPSVGDTPYATTPTPLKGVERVGVVSLPLAEEIAAHYANGVSEHAGPGLETDVPWPDE